jgi:hypothetical protein
VSISPSDPSLRRALGSLDRTGDEGRNSVLHGDRLGRVRIEAWLNGSLAADALRPAAESALREWPVSRRVNRTGVDDDPTIIEKVVAAQGPEAEDSALLWASTLPAIAWVLWVKIRVPEK